MNKQTETALKMVTDILDDELWFPNKYPDEAIPVCFIEALKACKEALEQPAQEYLTRAQQVIRANNSAQEPVAWRYKTYVGADNKGVWNYVSHTKEYSKKGSFEPLYTHPCVLTHSAPSWQGLSDDEIHNYADHNFAFASEHFDEIFNFARAIEQALKEKNNA